MNTRLKPCLVACFGLILSMIQGAGSLAGEPVKLDDRMRIFNALNEQNLLHEARMLARLVHLCNLVIENESYPVIDVVEHVKGAQIPHGVIRILVLDASLKLTKEIDYDRAASPLYCKDNQLFWFGFLEIDGLVPEGNVLTFSDGGQQVIVSAMEPNDFPARTPPQ